ncbi:hypothetical protein NM688_g4081 [Phlebia brevispora]|uniref:Uncharacterized protein n=1 Tax=Phlebia brevispora TaxID=194682 RepID=A0ACC1T3W6_9APHY|nr:hypothetical protein NM688_g4081 [Phlebia brevispora]
MNSRLTIALCVSLHAILVLIYAAILATYSAGVYNRPVSVSPDIIRTVITVVSQSFTIAYCALLALLTQRITQHEFVKRPQTLTAIHDKSFAWLGLGSSLQTLSRQRKLATDILGISMITLYLILIFVVHTTLPGIYGVTTENITVLIKYPTTLARQWSAAPRSLFDSDSYSILQVRNTLNLTTPGVFNNVLYDIIPAVQNATGAGVEVNATTFSVDCAPLSDVDQTGFNPNATASEIPASYNYEFAGGKYSGTLLPMGTNQLQLNVVQNTERPDEPPSMLVVTSTFPVVDSAGEQAPAISMNPRWQYPFGNSSNPSENLNITVSFLGCNFGPLNSTLNVDARSRTIDGQPAPAVVTNWHEWADPGVSPDPMVMVALQHFVSFAPDPLASTVSEVMMINSTFNEIVESRFSILEWFLSTDIPSIKNNFPNASPDLPPQPMNIGDLNWSLGRAYTTVLWYYNNMMAPTNADFNNTSVLHGQASIATSVLQERMTVNEISLITGLVASCLLFILAIVMIARCMGFASDVLYHDVSGLLPILWLLGNEPRVAELEEPNLDALREAGMYFVPGMDRLRRHSHSVEDKLKDDVGAGYKLEDTSFESSCSSDLLLSRSRTATSDRTAV